MFCRLAAAAGECDFEEVELRLLSEARRVAPDDAQTLRQAARALTRQGRFEEAVGPWHAVAALVAGDGEARQAIEDLRFAPPAADERELADAQAARGADLALFIQRQELRLAQSAERAAIARRRSEHDEHPRAQALVRRLESDHLRLEIEMYAMRAEQFPTDANVRLELGRRLKQAGNYSGAVNVLEEAIKLDPGLAAALVELGECRQHLRQFEQALESYQRAISVAEKGSLEDVLLARYRAGVLAAAMGRLDFAMGLFEAILAVRPGYRDVEGRLATIRTPKNGSTREAGRAGPSGPT
jgi:tetratricopeptide (TPR) repeat protein